MRLPLDFKRKTNTIFHEFIEPLGDSIHPFFQPSKWVVHFLPKSNNHCFAMQTYCCRFLNEKAQLESPITSQLTDTTKLDHCRLLAAVNVSQLFRRYRRTHRKSIPNFHQCTTQEVIWVYTNERSESYPVILAGVRELSESTWILFIILSKGFGTKQLINTYSEIFFYLKVWMCVRASRWRDGISSRL